METAAKEIEEAEQRLLDEKSGIDGEVQAKMKEA